MTAARRARPRPAGRLRRAGLSACSHRHQTSAGQDEQKFLDQNRKLRGRRLVLGDGLQYKVVASGPTDGPHPAKGDEVKVDYTGSLLSGSVFDSTSATGQPAVLELGHLIPAWQEVLPRMRPGDDWLIYTPPKPGLRRGRPSAGDPAQQRARVRHQAARAC